MQRNMDLVRTILMRLESNPSGKAAPDFGNVGYTPEQIGYHSHIMMQEGLLEGNDVTSSESAGRQVLLRGLTWKGHEFLDLARDQDRWSRARAIIAKVGGAPIAVWMKVLTDLTMQVVEATASSKHG